MQKRHVPERMCVICRKRAPKGSLLRFVVTSDGQEPLQDPKAILPGRGMYVCEDTRCREVFLLSRGKKKKSITKSIKRRA